MKNFDARHVPLRLPKAKELLAVIDRCGRQSACANAPAQLTHGWRQGVLDAGILQALPRPRRLQAVRATPRRANPHRPVCFSLRPLPSDLCAAGTSWALNPCATKASSKRSLPALTPSHPKPFRCKYPFYV
jgi:hypothetical protein